MLNSSTNRNSFYLLNSKSFKSLEIRKTNFDSVLILEMNNLKHFIKIPNDISFSILDNKDIRFFSEKSSLSFIMFKKNLDDFNSKKHFYKRKLELNGLGFKFLNTDDIITLKLGYSHLVHLQRPKTLTKIAIRKKKILLEGIDKIKLSNFANLMYQSRKYDNYKGKGFFFSNTKRKLKEIKKK